MKNKQSTGPDSLLHSILSMPRPAGGKNQGRLIKRIRAYLRKNGIEHELVAGAALTCSLPDSNGNSVDIGWACHTDTVDWGKQTKQVIYLPATCEYALVQSDSTANLPDKRGRVLSMNDHTCLGADDGAGVWLLMRMIEADIPGRYLFFLDEEIGARGAKSLSDRRPDLFPSRIFEFDRKGVQDVVYGHSVGDSASHAFAKSVADLLSDPVAGLDMRPSDGGAFTDICFCPVHVAAVNIACGYSSAHSSSERLFWPFLSALLARIISGWQDLAALPVGLPERDVFSTDDCLDYWSPEFDRKSSKLTLKQLRRMEEEDERWFKSRSAEMSDPFYFKS